MEHLDLVIALAMAVVLFLGFYAGYRLVVRCRAAFVKPDPPKKVAGVCIHCGKFSDDCVFDEVSYGNYQPACRNCFPEAWSPSRTDSSRT